MPTVDLQIRWADGTLQAGQSPSRAIEGYVVAGGVYPRDELRRRLDAGLAAASDRVRERFGMACTAAMAQAEAFETAALEHAAEPDALCTVMQVSVTPAPARAPAGPLGGHLPVVVIGGGQAGLSASRYLTEAGLEHVVLERNRIACNWIEQRWDSFCLVTPNWQCQLPGFPYRGGDDDGFMLRDQIVDYVRGFAASFDPPLHEGVRVTRLSMAPEGGFSVATSHGDLSADQVVLAVGGYHRPGLPPLAARLPDRITQVHSSGYRNSQSLPDGGVLVVGSGQSGAQIAEDLLLAGDHEVHLAVGSAPRVARFYRGRDCIAWLQDMGHYDMAIVDHPQGLGARHEPNHYMTGRDGGRDIDLRAHALSGMQLHGRLRSVHGSVLGFAGDLGANLDGADATAERIKDRIDAWIDAQGIDAPTEDRYTPVWTPDGDGSEPLDLAAADVNSIVWATGFHSDWSWVDAPAFDGRGYPTNLRGVTAVEGLYVLGLPWLHTWGSGRFAGIARDAAYVSERILEHAGVSSARGSALAA